MSHYLIVQILQTCLVINMILERSSARTEERCKIKKKIRQKKALSEVFCALDTRGLVRDRRVRLARLEMSYKVTAVQRAIKQTTNRCLRNNISKVLSRFIRKYFVLSEPSPSGQQGLS